MAYYVYLYVWCTILRFGIFFLAYKSFRRTLNILRLKYVTFSPLPWHTIARCYSIFFAALHSASNPIVSFLHSSNPQVCLCCVCVCVFFNGQINSLPLTFFLAWISIWFRFHPYPSKMYNTSKSMMVSIFVFYVVTFDTVLKNMLDIAGDEWGWDKHWPLFMCQTYHYGIWHLFQVTLIKRL